MYGQLKKGDKMSRTIKFRGKRLDNGLWAYGDLCQENSGRRVIMTNLSSWSDNADDIDPYGENINVSPETVGQFTGLHDKNGKEIYEGDVVRNESAGFCGVIKFKDSAFIIDIDKIKGTLFACLQTGSLEIIGNIYDNKLEDFK